MLDLSFTKMTPLPLGNMVWRGAEQNAKDRAGGREGIPLGVCSNTLQCHHSTNIDVVTLCAADTRLDAKMECHHPGMCHSLVLVRRADTEQQTQLSTLLGSSREEESSGLEGAQQESPHGLI